MIRNKDFKNFLTASRKLGENFYLTQGAGGNTSFKDGDYLYKSFRIQIKRCRER